MDVLQLFLRDLFIISSRFLAGCCSVKMLQAFRDVAKVFNGRESSNATGFLLEAGSRVPAPVYFEQSTRLLKVCN